MPMSEQKLDYLKTVDIFQDLSKPEIEAMDRTLAMSTCISGKVFYRPEDITEVLFILKKGRVQFYKISPDGKKLVVSEAVAGTVFGEMSILGQTMHNTFAESMGDCVLCVMSRYDVERMVMEKPQVGLRLMQLLSSRIKIAESQLESLAFKSLAARLAKLLLELSDADHNIIGYTHQDFADRVGVYRETVSQTLKEFKSAGIIETGRKRIDIIDRTTLSDIAAY